MNQDNTAIENQEEKQETFWSTMKYLFVQVPKELLGIGYPKSSPPPNEEIKRKCLGAAAGMACTKIKKKGEKLRGCESRCTKRPYYRQTTLSGSAKCQRKKHKISAENQEEKQETFWSTMKYLFVQVPKELLGIGYPKSSPPPNEEIKRKCLGAVAGMVCTEIKKKEKSFADVKADARNDRITDRQH